MRYLFSIKKGLLLFAFYNLALFAFTQNIVLKSLSQKEIDDIIFDGYGLLTFEKERIREFYQVNVERKNENNSALCKKKN